MIEIGVRSADMNPSDEVQPCFGPSSSAVGLEISGPVHFLLRIFSCVQWAYSQQFLQKKKKSSKNPLSDLFLGSTSKALFGTFEKKVVPCFKKIFIINYIINYINFPTFAPRVKNGPLGRTLMNGDGLQDYKIIIYFWLPN